MALMLLLEGNLNLKVSSKEARWRWCCFFGGKFELYFIRNIVKIRFLQFLKKNTIFVLVLNKNLSRRFDPFGSCYTVRKKNCAERGPGGGWGQWRN